MADARIPERYLADRRILRLTDAERSSLFMATVWSVSNRTDGRLERADLPLIPTFDPKLLKPLEAKGILVADGGDAWIIADYERDQTSRSEFEVLENARRRDREKKRRQRSKDGSPEGQSPGTFPGDDTGKDRQGQARQEQGQDYAESDGHINQQTGEVMSWPTAEIPDSDDVRWGSPDAPGAVVRRGAA